MLKSFLLFCLASSWTVTQAFLPPPTNTFPSSTRLQMSSDAPFSVIVEAEIEPDRMAEFLKMIENNAVQTRKEPDCIRFDVLRSQDQPNRFFFYELYKNVGAIDHHKKQAHYQSWVDFKESGGTISSVTKKADGEFLP